MDTLNTYFLVYIDRALTAASLEVCRVGFWTYDEWFNSAGDIERVQRAIEITEALLEKLESDSGNEALLGDVPVTDFCYHVLEEDLKDFVLEFASREVDAPTDEAIIEFITKRLAEEKAKASA
jgi:hypothetical protein